MGRREKYKTLDGKSEGVRPLGLHRRIQEDNFERS